MTETKHKILKNAIVIWGNDLSASLDDIAHQAGVSRRTLHRHYQGRDDLMLSVFDHIIAEYIKATDTMIDSHPNLEERLKAFLNFDIESSEQYMVFCQLRKSNYDQITANNKHLNTLLINYNTLFDQLKQAQLIRNELSNDWLEIFYTTLVESALISMKRGMDKTISLNMAWTSFWNGIKTQ